MNLVISAKACIAPERAGCDATHRGGVPAQLATVALASVADDAVQELEDRGHPG